MSNVFLKNKTSSAITVAGYTVHYMDKTDAVRQSMFDACEKLEHITRFLKQHITEE